MESIGLNCLAIKQLYDMCLFTNPWTFKLSSSCIHYFPQANVIENMLNRQNYFEAQVNYLFGSFNRRRTTPSLRVPKYGTIESKA